MRKISKQKIFIFITFIFITTCIVVYGYRFIYYYSKNKKSKNDTTLATVIKQNNINSEHFKMIKSDYYFINDTDNNYIKFSGLLYRIVKIDKNNNIVIIADNSVTSLALNLKKDYSDSEASKWLNNIYYKYLSNDYLTKTNTCLDKIDKLNNKECIKEEKNNISLLSIQDYVNSGASKSYLNNGENFYLSQTTKDNQVWYNDEEAKLGKNDGNDIYGIRPVLTLSNKTITKEGDGTKDNPYILNETNDFGAYVKLENQLWQVYDIDGTKLKLSLTTPLDITYHYSLVDYNYNLLEKNSLAFYLNNSFLYSLGYQDKILDGTFTNSFYGSDNDYSYQTVLDQKISAKVGLLSIGDVILNKFDTNYALATGTNTDGSLIYTVNKNAELTPDSTESDLNIIPCITIDKSILTKGIGTINSPYEME